MMVMMMVMVMVVRLVLGAMLVPTLFLLHEAADHQASDKECQHGHQHCQESAVIQLLQRLTLASSSLRYLIRVTHTVC